jgi:hypothetical protein
MTRVKMFQSKTIEKLEEEVNLYISEIEKNNGRMINIDISSNSQFYYIAILHYTFSDIDL